jgi:hypothetical protein
MLRQHSRASARGRIWAGPATCCQPHRSSIQPPPPLTSSSWVTVPRSSRRVKTNRKGRLAGRGVWETGDTSRAQRRQRGAAPRCHASRCERLLSTAYSYDSSSASMYRAATCRASGRRTCRSPMSPASRWTCRRISVSASFSSMVSRQVSSVCLARHYGRHAAGHQGQGTYARSCGHQARRAFDAPAAWPLAVSGDREHKVQPHRRSGARVVRYRRRVDPQQILALLS